MSDILKLARIQLVVILIFAIFKLTRRTLLQSETTEIVQLFLLSFPNFCEGIIGVLTLTAIGLVLNRRLKPKKPIKEKKIYLIAVVLAAVYVISQELKFHNLGGNNVYDPMDVLFSIFGLATGAFIVTFIKPMIREEPRDSR